MNCHCPLINPLVRFSKALISIDAAGRADRPLPAPCTVERRAAAPNVRASVGGWDWQ